MGKRNSESGQALIMAVLVMLIVAVLAALFIAVIAVQLRQAQRQSSAIVLQEIAEAGLRYANANLVEGPEGADWRPSPNPQTSPFGGGEFRLTVTYDPQPGDPYSRFIKIESLARLVGNPFLRRRLVAYKPILITDYVRFVANGEKSPLPASLGANAAMYLYEDPSLGWPDRSYPWRLYKTVLDGPIRVNTDLTWHGDVQVNLSSGRGDNVAVAGNIRHDMMPRWDATSHHWDGDASQVLVSVDGGTARAVLPSEDPGFTALSGYYRDGRLQADVAGNPRWVRYLDPPSLDARRYLALTRDSGSWADGAGDYAGRQVNTGWFGYGKGIYIANAEHIKYDHDYQQMRAQWMGASTSWSPPDAVVIELDPGSAGGATQPKLHLTWRGAGPGFRSPTGEVMSPTLDLPFPENGVIYAAGDVAVRGTLPPRIGSPERYYGQHESYVFTWVPGNNPTWTPDPDTARHYHLTVVSGGNIFIEGNVMSPVSAKLQGATGETDTKLALLARDSVVFNTLQMQQVLQPTTTVVVEGTSWYEVRPDRPLDVVVRSASMDPIQIYLKHTGQPNIYLPLGRAGAAIMQVLINNVPYDWRTVALTPPGLYNDGSADYFTKYYLFAPSTPPETWTYNNETNAIDPFAESIPNTTPNYLGGAVDKRILFSPLGINEDHVIRFQVTPESQRFYWVNSDIRARVDVEIDAAMYAEHGSWFIIPGAWVTDPEETDGGWPHKSPPEVYDPNAPPQPLPGEPLDIRITVRGAISENRTAPLADVTDWTAKWRGSDASWLPSSPNYDSDLGISSFTLRYLYDGALRASLIAGEGAGPPRLPKLPVSPAMIAWGERI